MHHRNAPSSVESRRRARCQSCLIVQMAVEMDTSRECASKWVNRWRRHGETGLLDLPSVPRHQSAVTPPRTWPGSRWPAHVVHLDVKKTGQIPDGGGWRIHGKAAARTGRSLAANPRPVDPLLLPALRRRRLLEAGLHRTAARRNRPHRDRVRPPGPGVLRSARHHPHELPRNRQRLLLPRARLRHRSARHPASANHALHPTPQRKSPRRPGLCAAPSWFEPGKGMARGTTLVSCVRFVGWSRRSTVCAPARRV
ncbi:hypothetical protein G3I59_46800 [Amycolatopsis rubida]|uniref:DNA-binding domain-containing protein n=1 Tax=Amycolatopsis rubida TaxID=112413 RepID=A0ABX0C572_9PSEU|nr:hypothetical protein [Amycolatopsis rubida]NEC62910.1 hypothetical protein [Amycolatopsis rubida]